MRILLTFVAMFLAVSASAADQAVLELQRQQLLRGQQQNELQLKMQQYQDSVLARPDGIADRLRRNELELSQRWRQQQLHTEQLRREQALRATPAAADPGSLYQLEGLRAERAGQAQLQQFRREREAAGSPVTRPGEHSAVR